MRFKNILVIRNDRFGEFLLNIPAIRALKEAYPQAKLTLAVNPLVKELAQAIECVDAVVVWDDKFRKGMRKQKFDACLVLNPTKEAHWSAFITRIPVRVGYNRKWGFLLTHKLKDTKHLGDRHEVDCNLELVNLIASPRRGGARNDEKDVCPRNDGVLRLPRNDKYEFLAGAIAIHPFTSDPVKQWSVERFKELAQRIKRELGLNVVMVGLIIGKDKEIASAPAAPRNDEKDVCPRNDEIDDGIVNMVNKTSLVELAALLKCCSLLISGDSGPVHLAAAVGTPVIALFRNDLPGKTARRWGPWGQGHVVIEKSSLNDISLDEVLEAMKGIIN
jgi:ADP-heptose:LPS heptosyltransferase